MGSRSKVLIQEVELLKNPAHLVALSGYKTKSFNLTPGDMYANMEKYNVSEEWQVFVQSILGRDRMRYDL